MLDSGLAEIVANLRALGADIADVEVKNSSGGLPKSLRDTPSVFSNTGGGAVILGLDEGRGFAAADLRNPAKLAADLGSMRSSEMEPTICPLIQIG
jgi:ATP-dependent DNA helicase RecG